MILAIDFDGTCVTHEFPEVGKEIGAVPVLKKLTDNGHRLILWTMRCNGERPEHMEQNYWEMIKHRTAYLDHAVNWFKENDIPLFGVQRNPEQDSWSKSPKAYAQIYIDDASLGCPLDSDFLISPSRPFADWSEIERILKVKGLFKD